MACVLRSVSAVRIFTHDLDRARHFYADVLDLDEQEAGSGYAIYALAGMEIIVEAVAEDDPESPELVGRLLSVSFEVEDVETAYRTLSERGVSFVQPPERQQWGGTLAFAHDPDANVLTLVEYPATVH